MLEVAKIIRVFFGKHDGPNKVPKLTTKQGFATHLENAKRIAAEVVAERAASGRSSATEVKAIQDELEKVASRKRTQGNSKAHEAAMKALAEKRASRRRSLVDP